MTYDEVSPREKTIARALAAGMHVAFVVLLVFGVSWQKRVSEPAAVVDLWRSLPPVQEPPAPAPAPKAEAKPEPPPAPKPAPKPQVKPTPKPEVKSAPKPDIALKEKLEKERKLKERELEKQREIEKRKEDEAKKAKAQREVEVRKKEEEKRKLEKDRLAQEAEAKKLAAEKHAITEKLAKEQAAQKRIFDQYVMQIQNKVKRYIVEPPNLQGNPQVEFDLRLLPGGDVLEPSLRLRRSSGNPAYDQAVERAILKASPLPLPPDPALFDLFRELHLKIRPRE